MKNNLFRKSSRLKIGALMGAVALLAVAGAWVGLRGGDVAVPGLAKNAPVVPIGMLTLRGEGDMVDLHTAQIEDAELRAMVMQFAAVPSIDLLVNGPETDRMVTNILFRWAGVDGVNPDDFGPGLDGRVVAFLQRAGQAAPDLRPDIRLEPDAVARLSRLWGNGVMHYKSRLLAQAAGDEVYNGVVQYNPWADRFTVEGNISPEFAVSLAQAIGNNPRSADVMGQLLDLVDLTRGLTNLTEQDEETVLTLYFPETGRP